MIRPLATFLRALDAARTAGTLARTVRVLGRQLDNAHLLAASEEARADRAEIELATARERIAELEHQLQDWREASGELAAEQPADDPLPSVLDAGEAPIPPVLTDSAREADIQRDRADALQRALQACEVELQQTRAQLRQTEAAAGAHLATIEALREELADALRDAAKALDLARCAVFTQEQPLKCRECGGPCEEDRRCYARPTCHRCLPPPPALKVFQLGAPAEQIPGVPAAPDDPPPTRPSERTTDNKEPRT